LAEARRAGVLTPSVLATGDFKIFMEYIRGERIKEYLNSGISDDERAKIATEIGKNVGKLHSHGIVHGDLTTSNMILKEGKIYFIDFGLGELTRRTESIATDLSVLEEAFKSTHFRHLNILWDNFIKGYRQTNEQHSDVLKALDAIRLRVRYVKRDKHED
jgi:Kae1-associated kinase Bud32